MFWFQETKGFQEIQVLTVLVSKVVEGHQVLLETWALRCASV